MVSRLLDSPLEQGGTQGFTDVRDLIFGDAIEERQCNGAAGLGFGDGQCGRVAPCGVARLQVDGRK